MERKSLIDSFATHPVAMNILMTVIIILGYFSASNINIQFLPSVDINFAYINTVWPSAAAEDVERSITNRLELELKNLDNLVEMTSNSRLSFSRIYLDFDEDTDMSKALSDVKNIVDRLFPELPAGVERPEVVKLQRYEHVATLIVVGDSLEQLRVIANQYKEELSSRGIGKIDINGLPDEEVAIQISRDKLREYGLSLNQVAQMIRNNSRDVPIGISGRDDAAIQLRIIEQRRDVLSFENLTIYSDAQGQTVKLSDLATVEWRLVEDQPYITMEGKPAVELHLRRAEFDNTLKAAEIMHTWVQEKRLTLPESVQIKVFEDQSIPLRDRISILLENGILGLALVLIVLYIFLNSRVAFWTAVGIPVAILGAITILHQLGGTLNMVTLFALIMTIGIVVDDAIVVGENSLTRFSEGLSPAQATCAAARRMYWPILAASLTTIFAFTPVLIASGYIGGVLSKIALVVICVVVVSLVEAFLILPGHLRHSFEQLTKKNKNIKRPIIEKQFMRFRDTIFRRILVVALENPVTTVSIALAIFILTISLFTSDKLKYNFFPTPELNVAYTNVTFIAGTPKEVVENYLNIVEQALYKTNRELGGDLIVGSFVKHGILVTDSETLGDTVGDGFGSVIVELVPSDTRDVRMHTFVRNWQNSLPRVPRLESVNVLSRGIDLPGRDIEIELTGSTRDQMKKASLAIQEYLQQIPGVYAISDDTRYGRQQHIFSLTALGQSLGLTVSEISRQLSSSVDGEQIQKFTKLSA